MSYSDNKGKCAAWIWLTPTDMITKFIRKRNVNTALPFAKNFARVQVHSGGSETFRFTKTRVSTPPPVTGDRILTESGNFLNTENLDRLIIE